MAKSVKKIKIQEACGNQLTVPPATLEWSAGETKNSDELMKKKYEDYVAIKKQEVQETEELEDLMSNDLLSFNRVLDSFDEIYDQDLVNAFDDLKPIEARQKEIYEGEDEEESEEELPKLKTYHREVKDNDKIRKGISKKSANNRSPSSEPPFIRGQLQSAGISPIQKEPMSDASLLAFNPHYGAPKDVLKTPSRNFLEPAMRVDDGDRAEVLPEIDSSNAKNPSDIQTFEQIRNDLKIIRVAERTLIYAVVKSKEADHNVLCKIRCLGGIAFGGYARDSSTDSFIVECVEYRHLGTVPFGFKISMPKTGSWMMDIPIPEKVLEKSLTPPQRKALVEMREKYPFPKFDIFYLQMSLSN